MPNDRSDKPTSQESDSYTLCGHYEELRRWLNLCPAAGTITAWSETLATFVIGQTRCKRWSCPHCGPRRIAHLTKKTVDAKPNKLVTLTVRPKMYDHPREAYDKTRKAVSKLTHKIRNEGKEWEYLRVLEVTKKGWPHYHLVVRGDYVKQQWLADEWYKLSGAWIVDIRRIKKQSEAASYVMKYLYKQKSVPWTDRRVSFSRNFFAKDKDDKPEPLFLIDVKIEGGSPASNLNWWTEGTVIERIGNDMWKVA